jgi:hypothetical protein
MTSNEIETIEVSWQEGARLMDDCTYLFATDVRELEELTLGLTIVEAKLQAPIESADVNHPLGFLRIGARPIQEDQTCRLFQVVFDRNHLISYTVLNESYGKYPEPPEAFTGKLFRVFSQSHLLDFTERTTYASAGHPAPLMHFEIACLNQVATLLRMDTQSNMKMSSTRCSRKWTSMSASTCTTSSTCIAF